MHEGRVIGVLDDSIYDRKLSMPSKGILYQSEWVIWESSLAPTEARLGRWMTQVAKCSRTSPGGESKWRNPAPRCVHGSDSNTNQDYLKQNQHGESLVIQSTIAVIAQEQDTPVTVQDRAPSHQSMHTVKGQQTKSQGQGHKAQTKRTAPYQRPGQQPRRPVYGTINKARRT